MTLIASTFTILLDIANLFEKNTALKVLVMFSTHKIGKILGACMYFRANKQKGKVHQSWPRVLVLVLVLGF